MTAQIIDGKLIAQQVREEVAAAVAERVAAGKQRPTLATAVGPGNTLPNALAPRALRDPRTITAGGTMVPPGGLVHTTGQRRPC